MFEKLKNHFENINDHFNQDTVDYSLNDVLEGMGSKLILLETSLNSKDKHYSKLFLRGFERNFMVHYEIARYFFEMDLGEKIQKIFSTDSWPVLGAVFHNVNPDIDLEYHFGSGTPKTLAITHEGVEIYLRVLGGQNFMIRKKEYLKTGESQDFGPISKDYIQKFEELRAKVSQTEQYKHIIL